MLTARTSHRIKYQVGPAKQKVNIWREHTEFSLLRDKTINHVHQLSVFVLMQYYISKPVHILSIT